MTSVEGIKEVKTMNKIEIPDLDPEKLEEIKNLNNQINTLDIELRELEGTIPGARRVLNTLEAEKEDLTNKARDVPELYEKQLKDKEKQIKQLNKLINEKEKKAKSINAEIRETEKVKIPNLENDLYLPKFIELQLKYWGLQQQAFNENSDKYESQLIELDKILTGPGMNRYNLIRAKDIKLESLTLDNCR